MRKKLPKTVISVKTVKTAGNFPERLYHFGNQITPSSKVCSFWRSGKTNVESFAYSTSEL